jgi:hypothetical protein
VAFVAERKKPRLAWDKAIQRGGVPGEGAMKRIAMVALTTAALLGLAAAPRGDARAERRIQLAFHVEPANASYTQQHVIDVGDVPGHQLRLFEVRRTYPNNPLVINGLKIVESWTRGVSDYTNNNGPAVVYHVYVAENGDKFFVQSSTLAVQNPGSTAFTATTAGPISGGTGKLAALQGFVRMSLTADPTVGLNETQIELEYWLSR